MSFKSCHSDLNFRDISVPIVLLNTQSVKNKKNQLEQLLIGFSTLPILMVTETWLKTLDSNMYFPCANNYTIYRSDREGGHGGVAILIPGTIPSAALHKSIQCKDFETVWCRLVLDKNNIDLGVIYRPPRPPSPNMPKKLIDHLSFAFDSGNPTIIGGDFNYSGIDWFNNVSSRQNGQNEFLEFFNDSGFSQLVNFPTRNQNTLDLLFTNEDNLIQGTEIGPKISDHETVVAKLSIQSLVSKITQFRDYKHANFENIQAAVVAIDWVTILSDTDPNILWNKFLGNFLPIIDKHIPLRTVSCNNKQTHSIRVKKLCTRAYNLHKKWKNSGTQRLRNKYLAASRLAQREKRNETLCRENKILQSNNVNSFWKYVKSNLVYKSSLPCLLDTNNKIVSDSKQKADLLNQYFCSVFVDDDNIEHDWRISEPTSSIETVEITPALVFHKLKKLPAKLSCGPDGIPPYLLKKLAAVLDNPLSIIFSKSLVAGKPPDQWKHASVKALHKKGQSNLVSNYRPISLTSAICKVMESIISDKIKEHMSDRLFAGQHGFLAKKSTVTQLFESFDDWVNALDSNKNIDIAFIDWAKAFDSISTKKLISKLRHHGITGELLEWITQFLSHRTQSVLVDDEFSEIGAVRSGVPQGSVIGPLLFLIFIDDLSKHLENCTLKLFADDCKIYVSFCNKTDSNHLQHALNTMSKWAVCSQLRIQPSKCAILHLGSNNPKNFYYFGNDLIPSINSIRDLGVCMDSKLNFDQHTENICKTANMMANLILRTFKSKRPSFMIKLFNAFVRSKLEYASQIWNPHTVRLIDRLEKVQRRFTKRLPGLRYRPYHDRLIFLNSTSLELRRLQLDLTFLYKIFHGHVDIDFTKYFELKKSRTRGHSWALISKHSNKDLKKFSFACRIVNVWNFLPETSVSAPSVPAFKKSLHSIDLTRFLRGAWPRRLH